MFLLGRIVRRALLGLFLIIFLYIVTLAVLAIPLLQRHALYLHKLHSPSWWLDINNPEQFGFAKNQVTPFTLNTPDNETIYAWHVLPTEVYAEHAYELWKQPPGLRNINQTQGFRLLRDDPDARLIISFHGNAGTIAQGWRPESYRALLSGNPNTHVLAIDYRGFGFSTGSPTEKGLITDGIMAVDWAVQVAKVPPEQIVLFGHSLGTAVSVAVAEHFAKQGTDFAGIILYAALANLPSVLLDPSILGLLYPLRMFDLSKDYLAYLIVEFWETGSRIETLFTLSKRTKLYLIHSLDDYEIRPRQTFELFLSALTGACTLNGSRPPIDRLHLQYFKKGLAIDLGDGASYTVFAPRGTKHLITEHIIPYGYHSQGIAYAPITYAVHEVFASKSAVSPEKDNPQYWPELMFESPFTSQAALECILHPDIIAKQLQATAQNVSSGISLEEARKSEMEDTIVANDSFTSSDEHY